jgi:hypothetical protein
MAVDLILHGKWVECPDPARCHSKIHLDMDLAEVQHVPRHILFELINAFDPPSKEWIRAEEYWDPVQCQRVTSFTPVAEWWDRQGELHRDYGLPARVLTWYKTYEYWEHGELVRREKVSDAS